MTVLLRLLLVCALGQAGLALRLRCNSLLRPFYPQYFTHCECVYSEWSEWTYVNESTAADSACASGESYGVIRNRSLASGYYAECNSSETEIQRKCIPSKAERLIALFGLGGSDTPNGGSDTPNLLRSAYSSFEERGQEVGTQNGDRCPARAEQICSNITQTIFPRSAAEEEESFRELPRASRSSIDRIPTDTPEDLSPLPFVWKHDHMLFRRQLSECNKDTRYLLFLLDTSGSIGRYNFHNITEAISNITAFLCQQVQVAVMTFSDEFYLEFCFNCYKNDPMSRSNLRQAIRNIEYHGGNTHTGGAAKCACMDVLHESCGLLESTSCLDIAIITDGNSNDPQLDVCKEIQCLHEKSLNTFVMGIGDISEDELKCIEKSQNNNMKTIFSFDTVEEIIMTFKEVVYILELPDSQHTCINSTGLLEE